MDFSDKTAQSVGTKQPGLKSKKNALHRNNFLIFPRLKQIVVTVQCQSINYPSYFTGKSGKRQKKLFLVCFLNDLFPIIKKPILCQS